MENQEQIQQYLRLFSPELAGIALYRCTTAATTADYASCSHVMLTLEAG